MILTLACGLGQSEEGGDGSMVGQVMIEDLRSGQIDPESAHDVTAERLYSWESTGRLSSEP